MKKFIIFAFLVSHFALVKAQSWETCYDSTKYYASEIHYAKTLIWADKFMLFSNTFITKKEIYPIYNEVLAIAFEAFIAQKQKDKGLIQFLAWQKKIQVIYVEKEKNVIHNNKQLLQASLSFYLGEYYYQAGDYLNAKKYYESSLEIRNKLLSTIHPNYLESLERYGKLLLEMGNIAQAEKILTQSRDISLRLYGNLHPKRAGALNELGDVFAAQSDTATAIDYYSQAKNIYQQLHDGLQSLGYAHNLTSQGELYYKMGFYTAAEALYRQAQYIYEKQNYTQKVQYADLLSSFSQLYLRLNNFVDAQRLVSLAKAIHQKVYSSKHPAYGKDLYILASIYLAAGYPKQAEELLKEAVEIYRASSTTKQVDYLLAVSQLAEAYEQTTQLDKADALFLSTIDSFRLHLGKQSIELASIEANLANLYYQTGKYKEAIDLHERSLQARYQFLDESHPEFLESINDLSMLYWADNKISQAENFFNLSIENYTKQFNRYFSFLSEREKEFYYNRIRSFFEKYNSFALSRSKEKPAILGQIYNNQLTNKGLLFYTSQNVREQVLNSNDEQLFQKYKRWVQLKEQLSKVYKLNPDDIRVRGINLDSLEEVANFIEKDLSLRIAINNTKEGKAKQKITWQDLQKKLNDEEAVIEMIRFQDFVPNTGGHYTAKVYYAALIITAKTKKHPELVLFDNGEDIEKKHIRFYRNSIKFRLNDTKSYKNFWEKIDTSSVMSGIKKVYFSPDGVYNQLNINTLFDSKNSKFIFDKLKVQILTNTRDLLAIKDRTFANKDLISKGKAYLLGYPNYQMKKQNFALLFPNMSETQHQELLPLLANRNIETRDVGIGNLLRGGEIDELPGTKLEVNSISQELTEFHIENYSFLGDSAQESKLKAIKSPTLLHIATHGFFSPDMSKKESNHPDSIILESNLNNPLLNSGLLLAGASNAFTQETISAEIMALTKGGAYEDGLLTAYEAMNLDLRNTDLVVLSACETGLGEIKNGEGVYGLQRAFQTAGAKTIIMSLWKVSDEATRQLMIDFYREYCKTKNKRQAFTTAQLNLRYKYPEAFFWGAFVMIGE